MSFWGVVFIVLMCLWLFGGVYLSWEPQRPYAVGHTLLPWACVAILGWLVLSGTPTVIIR